MRDLAALDGREIDVQPERRRDRRDPAAAGSTPIVDADMRFAGEHQHRRHRTAAGFDQSLNRTITSSTDPNAPTITLDLDARVGQITVDRQ